MKRNYVAATVYALSAGLLVYCLWLEEVFDFQWFNDREIPRFWLWWAMVPALGCAILAVASLVALLNVRRGILLGVIGTCMCYPSFGTPATALLFNPRMIHYDSFNWVDG